MKINLKTTGFNLTPSIETYIQEKMDSLDKILPCDESIFADVELAKTSQHHNKGDVFKAEVNLTVPGRLIRAVADEWDLRVAIDNVKDELRREISSNKDKNLSIYRRSARLFKKFLRRE